MATGGYDENGLTPREYRGGFSDRQARYRRIEEEVRFVRWMMVLVAAGVLAALAVASRGGDQRAEIDECMTASETVGSALDGYAAGSGYDRGVTDTYSDRLARCKREVG